MTERGSASVLIMAMAALALSAGTAALGVTGAVVAKAQAQAAADAAALAAVSPAGGCRAARHTAFANGTELTTCRLLYDVAWVEVRREFALAVIGPVTVRATAGAERTTDGRADGRSGRRAETGAPGGDAAGTMAPRGVTNHRGPVVHPSAINMSWRR